MFKQDYALQNGGKLRYVGFTVTYVDLQGTSGSGAKLINLSDGDNNAKLFLLGAGSKILGVEAKHSVAFAGGSLSAMTVSLGISGSATRYTAAFDCFQAVSDTALQETALFKSVGRAAQQLALTFTPTGDNCSAATAGAVEIRILIADVTTTGTLPA
jgi:hypothetical protein